MKETPVYREQKKELEKEELGRQILNGARTELSLQLRFLDLALGSLPFAVRPGMMPFGTDGGALYFEPDALFSSYKRGRVYVTHAYLHTLLHCIFVHPFHQGDKDALLWKLASDIAVESVLDSLYLKCIHVPAGAFRQAVYGELKEKLPVLTAEGIYRELEKKGLSGSELLSWQRAFTFDDHSLWSQKEPPAKTARNKKNWDDVRERMQTELETFSKEAAEGSEGLLQQIQVENRKRYDYREFLRKFSVLKEEQQIDPDSFDYIFYHYGMSMYGNMPLIEPQETREVQRIEEFVIVIDTSMSCDGELVRRFLEETYSVLSESESFFRHIQIHIIQCDDRVQSDERIGSLEELKEYMEHFQVKGQGGTDFRPAFAYVETLRAKKVFHRLRGLLYFTDGYGTFPVKMPPYETAFVFLKEDYRDVDVPPWAIKLILGPEDLKEERGVKNYEY